MSLKFFDKLSQNFIELLNDKDDYNVVVEVENKEKSFTAHSNVLKYRSSYFRQELENIQPNEKNIKIITKPSISSKIFDVILKYIYGGIVNLEKVETRFIFDLMLIANEFKLAELSDKLEAILIEDKASWLKTHFFLVYRTIFVKENFKDLENFCNDIVVKYPNLIFDSSDFTSLPESALISLIKRDDLQMKEVEIWDYIIKWGISQNPTLPTNPGDWTKEKFLTLKTILQQCLPHIRYFHITNIDIYDKVKPFKKILDKQLWEDINQHLVAPDRPTKSNILPARSVLVTELPPRTTEPFSTIISEDHAAEISSWIDRKTATYSTTNNPTLPTNPGDWTKEKFLTLKTILQQCLPHIRYFHITNIDIYDKVKPFKKILDKQLWEDINQHLVAPDRPTKSNILPARSVLVTELPPRTTEPFSTIISEDHAAEISSWIDRKTATYSTTNVPYKFELILCGTRDGFAPQTFWNICHGHACTIVVVKVKGTDEILGGYNPLTWDNSNIKDQWMETKDSFIFSLKNSILSRVKIIDHAILNSCKNDQKSYGPYFGFGFGLYSEKSNFNLDNFSYCGNLYNYYEKRIKTSSDRFPIDNYEVFKVIRKS
ncbi:hypothetical protein Glove_33g45 [Diversispora epigaea]|uniref:BTB domain-containing protein n=1 Tax=Diversispora epigaea TaxID=1348612 RepID=A0A397JL92_9GLOM|nr:hypothetical protein Glove_33g45 [Diversispora epigaea]